MPQNRERVFVVSILGEHTPYEFPKPIPLDKCITDILEDEVDEKYYIDKPFNLVTNGHQISIPQATKKGYIEMDLPGVCDLSYPTSKTRRGRVQENGKVSPTLTASSQDICYIECPENPSDRSAGMPKEQRLEFNIKGTSNTLTRVQKDNHVVEPIDTLNFVGGIGDKDWVGDNKKLSRNYPQGNRVYNSNGIACSQTSNGGGLGGATGLYLVNYRIRKLTPRECFRLMGLREDDIDKIQQAGISNTQQYKMAGNSIVVNVLEGIFRNLFVKK